MDQTGGGTVVLAIFDPCVSQPVILEVVSSGTRGTPRSLLPGSEFSSGTQQAAVGGLAAARRASVCADCEVKKALPSALSLLLVVFVCCCFGVCVDCVASRSRSNGMITRYFS